jgi:hypothetical protein
LSPRRALLVYAALAVLAAFYPALFGELPVPAGGSRQLLPDGGAPADRNDELSDVPAQLLPPTIAAADAYRAGRLPLRMAAQGCGEPLWANPVAQCVTPTTLLFLALPAPWAAAAGAALKLALAAWGAFLFARARGLSPVASGWAGLAFGFSPYFTTWMHFPQSYAHAFFPWTLVAIERAARGRRGGFAAVFAAVLLLLLGGYPEGEFFVALFGVAFFAAVVLRERVSAAERARRLGVTAAAALLAAGVTAAYTLPSVHAIVHGERHVQVARGTSGARPTLSARDFARPPIYWEVARFWIVPEAQGNPRDLDKFGPYSFAGRTGGYAGILVLAFAAATLLWRGAPRAVSWARIGALLTALYLLWYPPLVWLLQATPGLRELSVRLTSNRAAGILLLLLGLLAAFELDRIRAGGATRTTRIAVAAVLALTALVAREYARSPERLPVTAWRATSFALPAVLLVAALWLLSGAVSRRRSAALVALLVGGTAIDLLRIGARFNPGTRPEDYFPVTPGVRAIQQASHGGRFAAGNPALTGMAYVYGLEDVRVHDATAPADYEDVLGVAAGYTGPIEYAARVTRLDAPILEFLNVRARLVPGVGLRASAAPCAVLPDRLVGAASREELLGRIAAESSFLERAHVLGADESFSGAGRVLGCARPRPEELRVRVEAQVARVLVLPETDDGGWVARIGARRLETLRANGAFLAVRVPAGASEIVCRYEPPLFRMGLAIGAASAAIAAIVLRRARRA